MGIWIYFLFLLSTCLLKATAISVECKNERSHAKMCGQQALRTAMEISSKEDWIKNKVEILKTLDCIGDAKCDVTKSMINVAKATMDFNEKISEIWDCVKDDVYENTARACFYDVKSDDCFNQEYLNCVSRRLGEEPQCSASDVEKFESMSNEVKLNCQALRDYEEMHWKMEREKSKARMNESG